MEKLRYHNNNLLSRRSIKHGILFKKITNRILQALLSVPLVRSISTKTQNLWLYLATPKPHWANVDLLGAHVVPLNVLPMYFTTDVNSSAYGEVVAHAVFGGRIENLVYYTIGTGIGAGVIQQW